jgi:AraC family transcriptional regulator
MKSAHRGEDFVVFAERLAAPSAPHRHFVLQVSLGLDGPVTLSVDGGPPSAASGVVIASQTLHSQFGTTLHLFIDPLCAVGRRLRGFLQGRSHALLPDDWVADFLGSAPLERWLDGGGVEATRRSLDALIGRIEAPPCPPVDPRVNRVIARLTEDLAAGRDRSLLSELAALAGLSPSRLTHLFSAEVGLPIKQYVVWLRMVAALERFTSPSRLGEVAHEAGFVDQAAFARTYRGMWGRTASAFRSAAQIAPPETDVAAPIKRREGAPPT